MLSFWEEEKSTVYRAYYLSFYAHFYILGHPLRSSYDWIIDYVRWHKKERTQIIFGNHRHLLILVDRGATIYCGYHNFWSDARIVLDTQYHLRLTQYMYTWCAILSSVIQIQFRILVLLLPIVTFQYFLVINYYQSTAMTVVRYGWTWSMHFAE